MRLLSNHKILSTLAALAAGVLSVSCMQKEDFVSEVGYLCPPGLDLDVTVDNLADTKAGEQINLSEAGLSIPTAADVTYTVTDKDGNVVADKNGNTAHTAATWTEPLALPVGSYTITASAGTNTFGTPYFSGTASGTIESLARETPTMTLTLGNSLLKVSVGSTLAEHFTPSSTVTITIDGAEHTADYNNWFYAPSNTSVSMSLSGTNSAGNNTEFTYNNLTTVAGKAFNVICEKDESNWPVVTIPSQQDGAWANRLYITPGIEVLNGTIPMDDIVYEVIESSGDWTTSTPKTSKVVDGYHVVDGLTNGTTYKVRCKVGLFYSAEQEVTIKDNISTGSLVTAAHYNEKGVLSGTHADLNLGFSSLADGHILKTLYDAGQLKIENIELKKGSSTVRTASSEKVRMTHSNGWPYLPKGTGYSLNFTHRLNSETTGISSSISDVVTVPEPSFTVTLGNTSYSTYDKYKSSGASAANALTAETLYDASAFWTISSDIMSGTNYASISKTLSFLIDGNTSSAGDINVNGKTSHTESQLTGLAWGSRSLTATVTFDGVTKLSSAKTHAITGLPYTADRPQNSGNYAWTSSGNVKWNNSNYVELWPSNGTQGQIYFDHFYVPDNESFNISISHKYTKYDTFFSKLKTTFLFGSDVLINNEDLDNKDSETTAGPYNKTMSTSNKSITIKATYSAANNAATFYHRVYQVDVDYRD